MEVQKESKSSQRKKCIGTKAPINRQQSQLKKKTKAKMTSKTKRRMQIGISK